MWPTRFSTACAGTAAGWRRAARRTCERRRTPAAGPIQRKGKWCPWAGSNCRPLPYQGSALPLSHMGGCSGVGPRGGFGAGDESRTRDLNLGKVALYQLSYSRVLWLPDLGSNQGPAD
ncbi:protein of unknown function [Cupriavidus taiwanensis]|uniref:Uncharacterized protein n=1 Tax=Cupriavidus taiwanensis TaxID=164546 RepID=A0A7Z7JA71_9BURK|nr:protein of unknown function [Cupriavidus taiwanensis]SOZ05468.1 hypothetical protein CBM2595_A80153 [Cupriavidus taiwanensis]SOZ07452.1 hypothetical protein CBM2597_A90058 [Cupriavidus taiwanensis]SPC15492.1 hypothetical protein CBM2594_A70057 [Cupriavidus taiwanensis]SPD40132.1 protein of unknown function [Cupriavidus taiwanensis]